MKRLFTIEGRQLFLNREHWAKADFIKKCLAVWHEPLVRPYINDQLLRQLKESSK